MHLMGTERVRPELSQPGGRVVGREPIRATAQTRKYLVGREPGGLGHVQLAEWGNCVSDDGVSFTLGNRCRKHRGEHQGSEYPLARPVRIDHREGMARRPTSRLVVSRPAARSCLR